MATTYGYARVSTDGQAKNGNSLEAQEKALRDAGATEVYVDRFTGTKLERPQLDELLPALRPGDTLIVTKLDRLARTALDGLTLLESLAKRKVRVNILNMGVLDDSPNGRLMRTILLGFAEFERDMIVSRTQEGKAIARQKPGFKEGRPKEYTTEQLQHALELLDGGHSYTQAANLTGISKSTIQRAWRARRDEAAHGDGEVQQDISDSE